MSQESPEFESEESEESSPIDVLRQASREVRNLARTMALTRIPLGQRAWQDELHRLRLGNDDDNKRLTGVRINAAMKVLKKDRDRRDSGASPSLRSLGGTVLRCADSLLSGADSASKLSVDQLKALLTENI